MSGRDDIDAALYCGNDDCDALLCGGCLLRAAGDDEHFEHSDCPQCALLIIRSVLDGRRSLRAENERLPQENAELRERLSS